MEKKKITIELTAEECAYICAGLACCEAIIHEDRELLISTMKVVLKVDEKKREQFCNSIAEKAFETFGGKHVTRHINDFNEIELKPET